MVFRERYYHIDPPGLFSACSRLDTWVVFNIIHKASLDFIAGPLKTDTQ